MDIGEQLKPVRAILGRYVWTLAIPLRDWMQPVPRRRPRQEPRAINSILIPARDRLEHGASRAEAALGFFDDRIGMPQRRCRLSVTKAPCPRLNGLNGLYFRARTAFHEGTRFTF